MRIIIIIENSYFRGALHRFFHTKKNQNYAAANVKFYIQLLITPFGKKYLILGDFNFKTH